MKRLTPITLVPGCRQRWATTTLLMLMWAWPAMAERPVDERVEARAAGVVEISNLAGSVVIRGWERTEIVVEGTLGDHVEGVEVTSRGDRTVVEVKLPDHTRGRHDLAAELSVHVPAGSSLEVETVSAAIDVDGVRGTLELSSVSGALQAAGEPARIECETVSGAVTLEAETGELRVTSVSGPLLLEGRAREVRASSVSGPVELTTAGIERLEIQTVSTDIDLELDLEMGARVEASSHSGDIVVRLEDASAEISASSFSGDIVNQLGPAAERPHSGPGSELDFTLGRGDGRIELSTFSGDVRIEER